jgi:hypothetical protein
MSGEERAMAGLVGVVVAGKVMQEFTKKAKKKKKKNYDIGWGEDGDIGFGGGKIGWG